MKLLQYFIISLSTFIITLSTFLLKLIIINSAQATFYKFKIKLFQQLRSFRTTFIYNYFQHYNNIVPIKLKITDVLSPMNQLLNITYFAIFYFPVLNNQCPGKLFATFLNKVSQHYHNTVANARSKYFIYAVYFPCSFSFAFFFFSSTVGSVGCFMRFPFGTDLPSPIGGSFKAFCFSTSCCVLSFSFNIFS